MRLLLDTCAYSLAMRNNAKATALAREADELIICPISCGELFAGFARGKREQENRQIFKEFLTSPRVRICTMTMDTGEFYSNILNNLRRQGTPIPANDIWIAACAMQEGAKLVTSDSHFLQIPGLVCEFIHV